jgi:hypothetical protein
MNSSPVFSVAFLIAGLVGRGSQVRPPGRQEQESIRKGQDLFKGQQQASRDARIPDSHTNRISIERKQQ